jgi:hypothetical protein
MHLSCLNSEDGTVNTDVNTLEHPGTGPLIGHSCSLAQSHHTQPLNI